jgi:predicted outer membrane protein
MKLFMAAAASLSLVPLAGCATMRDATPDQRASCERMEQTMGTNTTHDHNQMKGMGANPMNLTHERCQQILAK